MAATPNRAYGDTDRTCQGLGYEWMEFYRRDNPGLVRLVPKTSVKNVIKMTFGNKNQVFLICTEESEPQPGAYKDHL